jgi:ER membrane protein complex subunit 7
MQLSLARALSLLSAALLAAAPTASASTAPEPTTTEVVLTFSASPFLANPHALAASTTHGTLTRLGAPAAHAPLTLASTLVFRNVTAGSYLADVHCATHGFAPLRVDVLLASAGDGSDKLEVVAWETFRGNAWENKGEKAAVMQVGGRAAFPVRCLGKKVFFQERGKCKFGFPSSRPRSCGERERERERERESSRAGDDANVV